MPTTLQIILLTLGSYLIGAIPGGYIVGLAMGRNLLAHGSGKTGTANTLSLLGKPAAVAVFVMDLLKGIAVVALARVLSWPNDAWLQVAMGLAAGAAIVGHNWSVWVRLLTGMWGGGRGIVTALGAMLMVQPLVVVAAIVFGALALFVSHYVVVGTLAGIAAAMLVTILMVYTQQTTAWILPGVLIWGLLVVAGFHDSIRRLMAGTETRIGRGAGGIGA